MVDMAALSPKPLAKGWKKMRGGEEVEEKEEEEVVVVGVGRKGSDTLACLTKIADDESLLLHQRGSKRRWKRRKKAG